MLTAGEGRSTDAASGFLRHFSPLLAGGLQQPPAIPSARLVWRCESRSRRTLNSLETRLRRSTGDALPRLPIPSLCMSPVSSCTKLALLLCGVALSGCQHLCTYQVLTPAEVAL